MPDAEVFLGLLLVVAVLTTVARRMRIAYPILLVLGGLVLSFIPGLPALQLQPQIVFLLFLPPLLYWESLNASSRDLWANLRTIASLAVGLVLLTIGVVAVVVHAVIPGLTWAAAFVLGTIVAPTDETAAAAIADRLGLPRRLVAIIEDESLLNDASSLVAYNVAVAAVVTGSFSLRRAGGEFVLAAVGGVVVGLAAGWLVGQVRKRLYDPPVENTISLLSGFASYLPAAALGFSGVLAVVAQGLYLARGSPRYLSARTRLQGREMWEMVTFLLNGLLFTLVGLQLHGIVGRLSGYSPLTLLWYGALPALTVILLRIAWVFTFTYVPRMLSPGWARKQPSAPWRETTILAWTGMRGGISLAAALAIPLAANSGAPFPDRGLIIYMTYSVILATLVLQGLTLAPLIQWFGVGRDQSENQEETAAWLAATQAGLQRLESLPKAGLSPRMIERLRNQLQSQSRVYAARALDPAEEEVEQRSARYRAARREILDAEREAIIDLRDQGIINDDAMRKIENDLDLEEVRLDL